MSNRSLGVAVVWLALFCDYLLMTIVIPIFPSLGVSNVEVGILFSAKAAVQVLFSPFVARVVDGYGLKPLVFGLFVELASSIGFTVSQNYWYWFGMRAVQGLASASILSSGFLHIQQIHEGDSEALGNAMGTVITGIISGVMVGPPLGGLLFELGSTVPFWTNAGFIGVAIGLTLFYDRKRSPAPCGVCVPTPEGKSRQGEEGGISSIKNSDNGASTTADVRDDTGNPGSGLSTTSKTFALLRDRHVLVVLIALMLANAVISCLEATVGLFLEEEMGMTPGEVGLMYIVTAFPSVMGSKLGGWLGNKFGRWKIIMIGMVLQGGFYALGPKDVLVVVAISFAGLGVGMGFVDGCAPALLSEVGQLYHDGTGVVFTLQTAAIQIGFIVGPVCGTALMQGYSFQIMSIVLGSIMVLGSPLMFMNRGISEALKAKNEAAMKAKSDESGACGDGSPALPTAAVPGLELDRSVKSSDMTIDI